jgi:hypothetical protein
MMKDGQIAHFHSTPAWLRWTAVGVFVLSVILNFVFGNFGNHAIKQVNDHYHLFVTPPPYTFAGSWTVIYILVLAVLIYAAVRDYWPARAYWASIAVSVLNALWVGVWSIGSKVTAAVALLILIALFSAVFTWWFSTADPLNSSTIYYAIRNVIAFYLGWVLVAMLLNFGVVLVHSLGLPQTSFVTVFWILAPVFALLVVGVIYWTEKLHGIWSSWAFWLAIFWAFFGAIQATIRSKHF